MIFRSDRGIKYMSNQGKQPAPARHPWRKSYRDHRPTEKDLELTELDKVDRDWTAEEDDEVNGSAE
tara:strand:- start:186 stop:383 length:198 start_codon:yes stop_codon:yes gene_type:complete